MCYECSLGVADILLLLWCRFLMKVSHKDWSLYCKNYILKLTKEVKQKTGINAPYDVLVKICSFDADASSKTKVIRVVIETILCKTRFYLVLILNLR